MKLKTTNTTNTINTTISYGATIAYKKHGVQKSIATYMCNNHWTIPQEFLDLFQTHFLRSWEKDHFFKCLEYGTITYHNCTYQVIYHRCSPYDIKRLYCDEQLLLSFRELHDEYKYIPTVLVTIKNYKK